MKRQISILACLLVLVAMVFVMASCTKPEDLHVHEYVSELTKEATCTENGELTYTCSCGETYVDEVQAKGHTPGVLPAVEPTCTTAGKTEGYGCTVCGLATAPQSELAPLGHELGAPATCTTAQVCARECGKVFVEALGHKAPAPTCTEASVCTVCDFELEAALGHTEVAATCTDAAYCSVCDVELADALGHTLEYACLSDFCARCEMEWVEATVEHEYFYECDIACMNCGEWANMSASHKVLHVEAKEPTCTELGNIEYWTCEYCHTCWETENTNSIPTNMMNVKIPMVDHEYFYACDAHCMNCGNLTNEEAAHTLNHVEAVAPTCTENGNVEYWICSDCGTAWNNENGTGSPLTKKSATIPATGHAYFYECDAHCMNCGELTNEEAAHSLDRYAAVAPTCTEDGNIEYWQCEFCGTCWDNENGTGFNLNRFMVIVPANGHEYAYDCDPVCIVCHEISNPDAEHDVIHVAAKAPTCTANGFVEHWTCGYCDLRWIDEDLTTNTSKESVIIPDLGGHKGYAYDRKCDTCNLYILPEVGEAFKLGMYVNPKNDTYYITGALSGYYLATTTNAYSSPDAFIEEANGGFYIYFMSGTTKKYISVQASGTYNNPKVGTTKGLFTLDEKTGALVTKTSNGTVYLGTYSTYTTVGASYISYITGSNASNVDKTQHLLRIEILEPHDCQMTVATCKAASKCTICGKVEGTPLPHTPGAEATCTAAQTCTVCNTTITAKLPHNYEDGECTMCGAAEPTGLVNAKLSFSSTANRTSYSTTKQVWEQNGVKLINDKASSSSNVGNYSNPVRLYQGSKVTIEGKGMTKVVIVRNSASKATAANIQSYIKSANSSATVTVSGNNITVVFATPVDSFYFSCGAQVRLDSITVNP